MTDDSATAERRHGERRVGLSCGSVAIIIAERRKLPRVPHRDTVRYWAIRWGVDGEHYTGTPGRFYVLPEGVEKILAELAELRRQTKRE